MVNTSDDRKTTVEETCVYKSSENNLYSYHRKEKTVSVQNGTCSNKFICSKLFVSCFNVHQTENDREFVHRATRTTTKYIYGRIDHIETFSGQGTFSRFM